MKYPHIHQKIFNEPWLIEADAYDSIRQSYLAHVGIPALLDGVQVSARPEVAAFLGQPKAEADSAAKPYAIIDGVAIVPMHGILGKMLSSMETMCGGADIDAVLGSLDAAYADPLARSFVLHVNSPGGTVTGGPEAAAHVAALAALGDKEIVAYTETVNASLAYYISSQAHRVFASPSSRVGSIGTVITLVNQVAADDSAGLQFTTFKTGKFKDMGNPHRALTQEETLAIQGELADINADFVSAVATARNISPESVVALEAAVFRGSQAQAHGLIDGTANSLAALLAAL